MSAIDRSELDGYETLVSELRANPPVASGSLRDRVLEGAPAPRRRRSRKRKLMLVVAPAAVVLAVGAALVHGFVSSGQSRPDAAALAQSKQVALGAVHGSPSTTSPEAATSSKRTLQPLSKGAQSFSDAYAATGSSAALGGSALSGPAPDAVTGHSITIPRKRLVHAVASLQVRVPSRSELSARTNQASQIVGSFGGYAQSVSYQNSREGYGEAVLQLRVPVQKAQAAIAKLSTLGTLLSQQVSTQDLQAKLTHETSGIASLRRAIAVYESALASSTLPASQRVIIQIRLNNARRQLSQLRHARTGTLAAGANADISLLLTTRTHAVVAHHPHKNGRFGRLLGSAAGFLGLEGIIVIYALIVISPVLLIAALAWWIVRERRRREERLLASA
jgi:hypothetical protein